jgi:hypothetical protein
MQYCISKPGIASGFDGSMSRLRLRADKTQKNSYGSISVHPVMI